MPPRPPVEVDAVLAERVGQRDPVGVGLRCRSSSWSPIEPAAALEPKSERPKRAPSSSAQLTRRTVTAGSPSRGEAPHHLDAGDDVQRSVQPAAVRDGVDVPADQHAPARIARKRPPLVARPRRPRISMPVELARQPFLRPHPRVRPGDALSAVSSPVSSCSSRSSATVRLGSSGIAVRA